MTATVRPWSASKNGQARYRRINRIAETLWFLLLLLLSLHFVKERIDTRAIPHGDEGSWMSVAAEFSKGNGFTTRWLEFSFLKPYELPRPDDYRYPGLTLLLGLAFKLFGAGYTAALWCVAVLFMIFGLAVYLVVRQRFGIRTACATLPLVYLSLLQIMYASEVYSEGLFGIGLALVLAVSVRYKPDTRIWWYLTGATAGILYLIRPNAILLSAALAAYAAWMLYKKRIPRRAAAGAFSVMLLIMLPWLIRSWMFFGNPVHLADAGGLLRAGASQPGDYSLGDFMRTYGGFYFIQETALNARSFFRVLHEQEHGLEVIPLLFCLAGVARRAPFFNGFAAIGFLLSLCACFYTSLAGSWAGVRYFSPFLPFVYAYGISRIFSVSDRIVARLPLQWNRIITAALLPFVIGICIAPVYYPHRYYERYYAQAPAGSRDFSAYYAELGKQLGEKRHYYAGSLAQINFPTGFNCIGIQHCFDETDLRRAQKKFNPALLVLTPVELKSPYFMRLINALKADGYTLQTVAMPDSFALFVSIGR
jgi:4-amino-4-deoxy-L-arabinose transferase-like glycosyltransferase